MATILLIVIYIAFIGLGIPDSLLGAAWPEIYKELDIPVSWASLIYFQPAVCKADQSFGHGENNCGEHFHDCSIPIRIFLFRKYLFPVPQRSSSGSGSRSHRYGIEQLCGTAL